MNYTFAVQVKNVKKNFVQISSNMQSDKSTHLFEGLKQKKKLLFLNTCSVNVFAHVLFTK